MRKKYITATIITLLINYFLDQLTKFLAIEYLKGDEPIFFLKKIIMIYYTENSGAFLSLGSNWPSAFKYIILLVLPLLVCLYGIYYSVMKEKSLTRVILLSTIIGGGLSNLIDRIIYDFTVVDFLNFGIGSLRTGILNVADLSVTFGAILFIIYEFKHNSKQKLEKPM